VGGGLQGPKTEASGLQKKRKGLSLGTEYFSDACLKSKGKGGRLSGVGEVLRQLKSSKGDIKIINLEEGGQAECRGPLPQIAGASEWGIGGVKDSCLRRRGEPRQKAGGFPKETLHQRKTRSG